MKIKIIDAPVDALSASSFTYINTFFTDSKTGSDKSSSVFIGNFPNSKVSQKDSGRMDKTKKNTSVPASVVYFFKESKRYLSFKYS